MAVSAPPFLRFARPLRPAAPQPTAALASWLLAHHLDYGLSGYWDANVTTLVTSGKVRLRSVAANGVQVSAGNWEAKADWYDPARNDANFIVLTSSLPEPAVHATVAAVRRIFGQPAHIYELSNYTILVWNQNLLPALARAGRS